jgi:hypothetical protein
MQEKQTSPPLSLVAKVKLVLWMLSIGMTTDYDSHLVDICFS